MIDAPARVSVIVPVYRVEPFVAECVRSIAAQELPVHELVLVDDRGGDASMDIAVATAADAGIDARVVTMPRNSGIGAARNAGLRAATGDLIWFCDADDTADPRLLAMLARRLRDDGSDLAICRTLIVSGTASRIDEPLELDGVVPGIRVADAVLRNELRGYASNRLTPAPLARAHPFAEGVAYEDLDTAVAVAVDCASVSLCAEPLYHYRDSGPSVSRRFSTHTFDLIDQEGRVREVAARHGGIADATLLRYRYEGVTLPLANMAARAPDDPDAARALRVAAARVRPAELARLVRASAWRLAAAAAVLRLSTRLYAAVLRRR